MQRWLAQRDVYSCVNDLCGRELYAAVHRAILVAVLVELASCKTLANYLDILLDNEAVVPRESAFGQWQSPSHA